MVETTRRMTGYEKAETLVLHEIAKNEGGLSLNEVLSTEDERLKEYFGVGVSAIAIIKKFLYFGQLRYQEGTGKFTCHVAKDVLEGKMATIA